MVKLRQNLLSVSKHDKKSPYSMNPTSITIHNTWNDASAENEVKYMIGNNNATGFHIAVDDKEAVQGIPLNRNAFHAGDGSKAGSGNRSSIGIEICYSKSGGDRYRKAEENAIEFVVAMLKERGWGIDRVKYHKEWSGKNCPHRILDEGRGASFKAEIAKRLKSGTTAAATNISENEMKELQVMLNKAAVDPRIAEDGAWGPQTEAAVKQFQRRAGLAVDGVAGPNTLNKLKAVTRETVAVKEERKVEAKQSPSPFAKKAWNRMTELGITDGSRPQDPITRQEVAVMLDRVHQLLKK